MQSRINKKRDEILKQLERYKKKDYSFSSGHILGSMCSQPHPIAQKAYLRFLDSNLGDPELFLGTKEIEQRLLTFISNLVHAPSTATGLTVSGGTEGNITAMWIAKQLSGKHEIIIPESAHFSFQKIASLMNMKLVSLRLTKKHTMDVTQLQTRITKQTAAVLGIAGSTELGTIDPLPEISDICSDEQLFLHVDAAFGGFVIPFLQELGYDVPQFDFNLKGVSTLSIDAHKMGYSAIPLGALIVKRKEWIDTISVESHCTGSAIQAGILGTRSGGPVAAAYAVVQYLGRPGYKNLVKTCMALTHYTSERITQLGLPLVQTPTMNVIGVKLTHLSEIVKVLAQKGWRVNKIPRLSCIRIVLMPQITKKIIDEFISVLHSTCKEVGEL
jgi:tyrosine decarboxylase/aspartate 1-decarboxylase